MFKNKKLLNFILILSIVFLYSLISIINNPDKAFSELKQIFKEITFEQFEQKNKASDESKGSLPSYMVTKVIDGDTIEVSIDGETKRVRYIGIDTPEIGNSGRSDECYANEATKRNQELVSGKLVQLEKDISETDKYGRLLRYVYVDDVLVNLRLVEEGYADVLTYPPDVAKADIFNDAKRVAKESKVGLWGDICR